MIKKVKNIKIYTYIHISAHTKLKKLTQYYNFTQILREYSPLLTPKDENYKNYKKKNSH